ncbi:MAG TPA: hypothetical protein VJL89_13035 [Thermodesulfovibrionia bacterium]|nr:hypothetical protein [Thermodesulfovibrionia bacterium]
MSQIMTTLTALSLIVLTVLSVRSLIRNKNRRQFISQLIGIGLCVLALNAAFDFPAAVPASAPRGDVKEWMFIAAMYVFMILGMLSQYLYNRFSQPERKRIKFDFGVFIAPIFASPLIFLPILATLLSTDIDPSKEVQSRIILFCVAFENGFFWKDYFDHKRMTKVQNEQNQ